MCLSTRHALVFGCIFTAGVRSTTGSYVFTGVCMSTPGRGYPIPAKVGTPAAKVGTPSPLAKVGTPPP